MRTAHLPGTITDWLAREQLPDALLDTIKAVYVPLAHRIVDAAKAARGTVVGICGAQGCGKSTLTSILQLLLQARGLHAAAMSLDDFYFARADREHLAAHIHPLLLTRGVPGTHDVALALRTLESLASSALTSIPVFDKVRDEPLAPTEWVRFEGAADVILFEGWCVGARPQTESALLVPINELERDEDGHGRWRRYVNDRLGSDYAQLFARLDLQVLLQAPGFDVVHGWRWHQESKLRARTRQAGGDLSRLMDEQALRRFVAHYERLTRHVLEEMPARADVVLELDEHRQVTRTGGL